jgi:hypothetical protein
LAATERDLAVIAAAVARARQPLRGKDQIGLGAVVNRNKMAIRMNSSLVCEVFSR